MLREIRMPSKEILRASRQDGRLKLQFACPEEDIIEGEEGERGGDEDDDEAKEEEEEEEEEEEDDDDDDDDVDDEEKDEAEVEMEWVSSG